MGGVLQQWSVVFLDLGGPMTMEVGWEEGDVVFKWGYFGIFILKMDL